MSLSKKFRSLEGKSQNKVKPVGNPTEWELRLDLDSRGWAEGSQGGKGGSWREGLIMVLGSCSQTGWKGIPKQQLLPMNLELMTISSLPKHVPDVHCACKSGWIFLATCVPLTSPASSQQVLIAEGSWSYRCAFCFFSSKVSSGLGRSPCLLGSLCTKICSWRS